jgi:carboxymethylenebutenolidase
MGAPFITRSCGLWEDAGMTTQRAIAVTRDEGEMTMTTWSPDAGSGPGILLIQEIFGVGPYVTAVAERLADAGYVVGAPDVFWRFAPGWEAAHDQAGLDASLAQVANLDPAAATGDCVAALRTLSDLDEVGGTPGVMGFCLGGTLAWGVAMAADPACCVSYYGSGVPSMLDAIDHVSCPTLFHFGNTDAFIPNEGVEAVNAAIAGRPGFVLNVENAGHAFDNHESDMFWNESAAQAAWAKTMAFLAEHLPLN